MAVTLLGGGGRVVARSADVEGLIWGPSFDSNFYWKATKN